MFKKGKQSTQQNFISEASRQLAPQVGDRVTWASPLIGSFVLTNSGIQSPTYKPPHYELVGYIRPKEPTVTEYMIERLFYIGSGEIIGSINHTVQKDYSENDIKKYLESLHFQIENRLFVPNTEDYDKLELYLKNGKLDRV